MKKFLPNLLLAAFTLATVAVCGCLNLKPARQTARYFVLSPIATAPAAAPDAKLPIVGVGIVKIPDYLFKSTMAVRQGTNEVSYLLMDIWAERLNLGIQRILAANLAALVPAQIRLSDWRSTDVTVGVHVAIEQFDVSNHGEGTLVAWWRVVSPGGEQTLKSGQFRATLAGPAPYNDPQGATGTLSKLAGQLSEEIAGAVKEVAAKK